MDSLNVIALVGVLERAPTLRFDADTGQARCSVTCRLEEQNASGTVFKVFVPLTAYGKLAEQLGTCHAGDLVSIQGKLTWERYVTKTKEERSTLACFVRQVGVLQATSQPAAVAHVS